MQKKALFVLLLLGYSLAYAEQNSVQSEQVEVVQACDETDFGTDDFCDGLDDFAAEVENIEHEDPSKIELTYDDINFQNLKMAAAFAWFMCVTRPYNYCVEKFENFTSPELNNEKAPSA